MMELHVKELMNNLKNVHTHVDWMEPGDNGRIGLLGVILIVEENANAGE